MPATIEEVKQYATNRLQGESREYLLSVKEPTERQLSMCLPEHLHVLKGWLLAIDEMLDA